MSDSVFRLAAFLRIGLPLLVDAESGFKSCAKSSCDSRMDPLGYHLLSCNQSGRTGAHLGLQRGVERLLEEQGMPPLHEPTVMELKGANGGDIRPDIGVITGEGKLVMLDVVVPSPFAMSALGGSVELLAGRQGESLRRAELRKNRTYDKAVTEKGGSFNPFAMSVLGVLGAETVSWLRRWFKWAMAEEVRRTGMRQRHVLGKWRFLEWVGRLQVAMFRGLSRGMCRKRNSNLRMVQAAMLQHGDGPPGVVAG
jgi:hypothetical protein